MIWSALVLGLAGSLHCLAMCGPLVVALNANQRQTLFQKILYNGGRVLTYALLGLLVGIFGSGVKFATGQQFLSILSGSLLLTGLLVNWLAPSKSGISNLLAKLKMRMGKMLNGKASNTFLFGMYNGLLPCGLTVVALAAALSVGNIAQSALYMALFGVGTSPMMFTIVSGFQRLKLKGVTGNRIVNSFTWILAILLIVRGLGLGIPYLSPGAHDSHESHIMMMK